MSTEMKVLDTDPSLSLCDISSKAQRNIYSHGNKFVFDILLAFPFVHLPWVRDLIASDGEAPVLEI